MGNNELGDALARDIPYLRRYARALTGSQDGGDRYAAAALEAIVSDPGTIAGKASVRTELFKVFHDIWTTSGAVVEDIEAADADLERRAQSRLKGLSANSREALLLSAVEGFDHAEIAQILSIGEAEAGELIVRAREEMARMVAGDVLIIEDEAIIAMDLEAIVRDMGHRVTQIARTRVGAVQAGEAKRPDLILADIQLADKSSGIDAVNDLLGVLGDVPVIFITAFPERLLTGERPEPAFLITKPYSEDQVRAAVSQAMFFSSTESLTAAS